MIVVASCGHHADDERIYYKQINAISKVGPIEYFTYNNLNVTINDDAINHHQINSNQCSKSKYKKKIFQFIRHNNPLILHIHDLELLPVAYKAKLNNNNIKIIYDVHEDLISMWDALSKYSGMIKKTINTILSKMELSYLKYVDCFILANKFADQSRYKKFGPVHIIQNFPINNYSYEQSNINKPYKLIYHGQLDYNRGIMTLINTFNRLSQKYNNLELKLVGQFRTPRMETDIKNVIIKNKNIKLIKHIPHNKIWPILYDSHIGVIPFHDMSVFQKNTPTKLFEFMATNCAVVSSNLQPICSVASESISFAHPNNEEALFSAIELYLNNTNIYKEHILLNQNMIKEKYNWKIEEKKLLNIYKNLIK
tara:strand:- start:1353 stop:2453 length:1101 start_codon:yes stop_codon:yes gene_type:complete